MKIEPQEDPIRILLADDDVDDRLFFARALKEIPMATELTTVLDGEQLMKYLTQNSENLPQILFLDLSMPRKTGFECLTEIKESRWLKDLPVIVLTTSFGRGIEFEHNLIHTLTKIGAEEYIRKPGDFAYLKEIIQSALVRHGGKDPIMGTNLDHPVKIVPKDALDEVV